MTKTELIAKYGEDWYNNQLKLNNIKQKERYKKDRNWRDKRKKYENEKYANDPEFASRKIKNSIDTYNKKKDDVNWIKDRTNRSNEYNIKRRKEDDEWRNNKNIYSSEYNKIKYVRDGKYELIENYELAKADNFKGWLIHHRLELTLDGEFAHTPDELKRLNMYYNRPAFELIWIPLEIHSAIHNCKKGRK